MVDTPASTVIAGGPAPAAAPDAAAKFDIANAITELERMQRFYRGFAAIDALLKTLVNREQVGTELDRRITAKRAEIDTLNAATIDAAKAEAETRAKAIVDQANADAKKVLDDAKAAGAVLYQQLDEVRAERDRITGEIATLKASAKALAG